MFTIVLRQRYIEKCESLKGNNERTLSNLKKEMKELSKEYKEHGSTTLSA